MSTVEACPESLYGPPLERGLRHNSPNSGRASLRLVDVDGERMAAAAVYKSMSMDVIEGHQIGLYRDDGTVRYPLHPGLAGSAEAATAVPEASPAGLVTSHIVRRRPASANPGGRTIKQENVRDVMKLRDIEGTSARLFHRARTTTMSMVTSDLMQKKSPSPRLRNPSPPSSLRTIEDDTLVSGPLQSYRQLHKYATMHRPLEQPPLQSPANGTVWQSVPGRAPYFDPLSPVYFVAAPKAVGDTAGGGNGSGPSSGKVNRSEAIQDLLQKNEQPSARGHNRRPSPPSALVGDAICNVVVSQPIVTKALHHARKGPGASRDTVQRNQVAGLLTMDRGGGVASSAAIAAAASVQVAWNKLTETKDVTCRRDANSKSLQEKLLRGREAASRQATNTDDSAAAAHDRPTSSIPAVEEMSHRSVAAYIDYGDVPFSTSQWKLRMQELRSQRKAIQRDAAEQEVAAERAEEAHCNAASRRPPSDPLCPTYPSLGASHCPTKTTHHDAVVIPDDVDPRVGHVLSRSKSPPKLRSGEHYGVASCADIEGTQPTSAWKRPPTNESFFKRIAEAQRIAAVVASQKGDLANTLTGTPVRKVPVRPSSAVVRSANTNNIAKDQRPSVDETRTANQADDVQAVKPPPQRPQTATLRQRRQESAATAEGAAVRNEISRLADTMNRLGISIHGGRGDAPRLQRPSSAQQLRRTNSASIHAASRKEVRYQQDIDSVRYLPNYV